MNLLNYAISTGLRVERRSSRLAAAAIATAEPLEHGERGVIINTASIAAYDGTIGQGAYLARHSRKTSI